MLFSKSIKVISLLIISMNLINFIPLNAQKPSSIRIDAQKFLDEYTTTWSKLNYEKSLAEWNSNTKIIEGDNSNAEATNKASEKLYAYTGSKNNIELAKKFLAERKQLTHLQVLQLERILFLAGEHPETAKDIDRELIAAETAQTEKLFGFEYKLDGKPITPNQIDEIIRTSTNLDERRKVWLASKEVGKELKDGLAKLQNLRNKTVQSLGYKSFFSYQVSDYGMTSEEMMKLMQDLNKQLRPLYRELHTYTRYELAKKYGVPVPDQLPADWLPNRWGQDWSPMLVVEGLDINKALKDKSPEWIVKQAEQFYVSLGWPPLPPNFWENSSLYPLPPNSSYKKNTHASAWHMDQKSDIRSLMSIEPNADWYDTTHHELGHIYYYISYSNPNVPLLLREGANRAYHEAMGTLMGLASMQKPFLEERGLVDKNAQVDQIQSLLKEALQYVVFIPFSAGTMSNFEYELYNKNLPKDQYNKRWWELVKQYQGIISPVERGEEYCDAATKTHINDDPAQYYDYALSFILLFQLHDHIARNILKQDPHATNYYGNKQVGDFLRNIMKVGSTKDWNLLLKENTGESLSAKAMLRYFNPLMKYLKKVNAGRKYTLPEL